MQLDLPLELGIFLYPIPYLEINSMFFIPYVAAFLILKLNRCKRRNNSRVSPFLVVVIITWLVTRFCNMANVVSNTLLLLLSENAELNP